MKHSIEKILPFILIIYAIIIAIMFINIASKRILTNLEVILLQSVSLLHSLVGSYIFGRQSASSAAKEIIKPHARSAFRRIVALCKSLSRLASTIESERQSNKDKLECSSSLDKMKILVIEQIATADNAIADWSDIIPEEIEKLRVDSKKKETSI